MKKILASPRRYQKFLLYGKWVHDKTENSDWCPEHAIFAIWTTKMDP